jgi:GTP-binding protein
VVNQTFELFDKLGATEQQLDFPVVYASALNGWATLDVDTSPRRKRPPQVPTCARCSRRFLPACRSRSVIPDGPLQLQISALDYSSYVGRLGIGRIRRGRHRARVRKSPMLNGPLAEGRGAGEGEDCSNCWLSRAWSAVPVESAQAGDIVLVTGVDDLSIGTTLTSIESPEALPPISVDEPTLSMYFQVNTSPLAGRDGKYVTSRNLRDRLAKEMLTNVALARRGDR